MDDTIVQVSKRALNGIPMLEEVVTLMHEHARFEQNMVFSLTDPTDRFLASTTNEERLQVCKLGSMTTVLL